MKLLKTSKFYSDKILTDRIIIIIIIIINCNWDPVGNTTDVPW